MSKIAKSFDEIIEIEKFNPYHDAKGRFSTPDGATQFTYAPGKSKAHDLAIQREKERHQKQQEEAEKPRTITLNQQYKDMANNWTFMNDKGAYIEREANEQLDAFREEFKRDDYTDEQKAYLKQRENEYADLLTEKYNDQLYREGTNPSWAVAGPAKFDHRKFERKQEAEMRSQEEYRNKQQKFVENTKKQLERMEPEEKQIARWRNGKWSYGETISADDPLAEKKLQAKLDYHTEQQQKMKDANAYYRKNGSMQGFTGFNDATNQKIDAQMQDFKDRGMPSYAKQPFQSYSLTNNNASIKSTRDRLTSIQNQKARAAQNGGNGGGTKFSGGEIVRNTGINRLQIKFDSIPDAATRQKLKSEGWHWSPREGAWQRKLNDNAESSASRILGITKSMGSKGDGDMSRYDLIEEVGVAKTFDEIVEIEKYNPYHDARGRFTSGGTAGASVVPYKGKAIITAHKISKENVDKHIQQVRKVCSNNYDPIEKEGVDIAKVKQRGGCSDAEAEACVKLADDIFEKAKMQEPQITDDVVSAVASNSGQMYGLAYRMKQTTSMAGKISADAKEDGISIEQAASKIKDSVRYTAVFEDSGFVDGYNKVKAELEAKGYTETRCKNFFQMYEDGTSCQKAVQCVFTNKDGLFFELQFHTYSTQGAKEVNHPFYEEQRAATTKTNRKNALNDAMTKISSYSATPDGVLGIKAH